MTIRSAFLVFSAPGLHKFYPHSRHRCETCVGRSFGRMTDHRVEETMRRSCSEGTGGHRHHTRCTTAHNLRHYGHSPSARLHSLDVAKVRLRLPTPEVRPLVEACGM